MAVSVTAPLSHEMVKILWAVMGWLSTLEVATAQDVAVTTVWEMPGPDMVQEVFMPPALQEMMVISSICTRLGVAVMNAFPVPHPAGGGV